jgi:putative membrane protein
MQTVTTQLTPTERAINWPALIETALLGIAATVLLAKVLHGVLIFYIHPRYTPLIIACSVLLLLVAGMRASTIFSFTPESLRGRSGYYVLLAIPLLLGTFVPARPLGANVLANGTDVAGALSASAPIDDNTAQWNLLQWATALSVRGDQLNGTAVDVVGFVFHDPAHPLNGFFVVRYVIICCTADGNGVNLPVVWKSTSAPKVDTWVRVRGVLGVTIIDDKPVPAVLATAVEPVTQPANPYLYP